jgi:hypothetical protein
MSLLYRAGDQTGGPMKANSFVMIIAVAFILLVTGQSFGGIHKGKYSDNFNTTLKCFMKYLKRQDYKNVWRMSSEDFRFGNDNDEVKYEAFVKSGGFYTSGFVVQKTVRTKTVVLATVVVTYEDFSGRKIEKALEEWKFVKENGAWFYDGFQTLSESVK